MGHPGVIQGSSQHGRRGGWPPLGMAAVGDGRPIFNKKFSMADPRMTPDKTPIDALAMTPFS